MREKHEEFKQLKEDMADINTRRGGGPNGLKGFYAEHVNKTYNNLERINSGIAARQEVIDNNGVSDAVIRYTNGAYGRPIQDKMGYTFSYHKKVIASAKYAGHEYVINPDNPVFSNEKQLNELKTLAKEHNIKIVKGSVTESELKKVAVIAGVEGSIREMIGLENTAPVTSEIYVDAKEIAYDVNCVKEKVVEVNEYIYDKTSVFLSKNIAQINAVGMNQAKSAAQFASALSIGRNAIAVLKGDEELSDAAKDVIVGTASAAVMGYATGAVAEGGVATGDASFLINGTIQISKQLFAYLDGEIDEEKMLENIAETSVQFAAAYIGRVVGGAIGSIAGTVGGIVGQFVGEMVTTAICADIISAIRFSEEFNKQNRRIISLYRNAEYEIRVSQARLEQLIQKENNELIEVISQGMDSISEGIMNGSYEKIEAGLVTIGEKFGMTLENFQKALITKDNLFSGAGEVIVFD